MPSGLCSRVQPHHTGLSTSSSRRLTCRPTTIELELGGARYLVWPRWSRTAKPLTAGSRSSESYVVMFVVFPRAGDPDEGWIHTWVASERWTGNGYVGDANGIVYPYRVG